MKHVMDQAERFEIKIEELKDQLEALKRRAEHWKNLAILAHLDELTAESARKDEELRRVREALKHAKMFIEYGRYELEEGKSVFPDLFPKKVDADNEIKAIEAALGAGGGEVTFDKFYKKLFDRTEAAIDDLIKLQRDNSSADAISNKIGEVNALQDVRNWARLVQNQSNGK